ncbi:hypothetical protein O181_002074 [Austropuccinia psidii MF-1]|uniref:Uncharacterized protein n=1 Tax=Austropuccinia psidii MF-1 TaxID=1389203 RepID=A0A9Q3BBN2_9BASI|nr:hypothetical protein [Austropuccinia psidii MF-1]
MAANMAREHVNPRPRMLEQLAITTLAPADQGPSMVYPGENPNDLKKGAALVPSTTTTAAVRSPTSASTAQQKSNAVPSTSIPASKPSSSAAMGTASLASSGVVPLRTTSPLPSPSSSPDSPQSSSGPSNTTAIVVVVVILSLGLSLLVFIGFRYRKRQKKKREQADSTGARQPLTIHNISRPILAQPERKSLRQSLELLSKSFTVPRGLPSSPKATLQQGYNQQSFRLMSRHTQHREDDLYSYGSEIIDSYSPPVSEYSTIHSKYTDEIDPIVKPSPAQKPVLHPASSDVANFSPPRRLQNIPFKLPKSQKVPPLDIKKRYYPD